MLLFLGVGVDTPDAEPILRAFEDLEAAKQSADINAAIRGREWGLCYSPTSMHAGSG